PVQSLRPEHALSVVSPAIQSLERGPFKDQCGELEIETPFSKIGLALPRIPGEAHSGRIHPYIRVCNRGEGDPARREAPEGPRRLGQGASTRGASTSRAGSRPAG